MRSWGFALLRERELLEGGRLSCYGRRDTLVAEDSGQPKVQLHHPSHDLADLVANVVVYSLTQVTPSIDPELVVRLCASERQ